LNAFQTRLTALAPVLKHLRRGIEKESLRVRPDGMLSELPHPAALGSALTHPHITTDFSEAQLELITGVHDGIADCLDELTQIHQVVYRHIGEEMLWCSSMPCGLPDDDAIPIGRYGSSNIGRAKNVYRTGLSYRYGRRMQTISGIHYNFSLPDETWPLLQFAVGRDGEARGFMDAAYFGLIRNFRRRSWLLLYLFGASPTVCSSFVAGRKHDLRQLKPGTLYRAGATSLRMGPLGYQSDAQATLAVSYNSLQHYARSLYSAMTVPYPPYVKIGIRDGESYRQLSDTLLQIENEFYGTIRPKRTIRPGERPLHALGERGVEYVEVRCMDLDPFCPIGITAETIRFLDVFLLQCLLDESPPDTPEEIAMLARNQHRAAARGREPGVRLERRDAEMTLAQWGEELVSGAEPIAAALDAAHGGNAYRDVLAAAQAALREPARTPSARILAEVTRGDDASYVGFARTQSLRHRETLLEQSLSPAAAKRFAGFAAESLEEQRRIEAADAIDFESFRKRYMAQDLPAELELQP
jgi:glutamate--cysteine ligase